MPGPSSCCASPGVCPGHAPGVGTFCRCCPHLRPGSRDAVEQVQETASAGSVWPAGGRGLRSSCSCVRARTVTSTLQQATLVSSAASSPCQASGRRGPPTRGVGERDVRMPREKPCSPGHCLGMFNDDMRTDMLRHVHQSIQARLDQRGTRSPLALLIESIEEVLRIFEDSHLCEGVGPNPFNRDPRYRWSTRGLRPETACHHDITVLPSQLGGLRELCAGLDSV